MEGYAITFSKQALRAIEAPGDKSKIILRGPTGSGKSTILLERYKYMVEKLGIPSEKILILLLNRMQSLEWRSKTVLGSSGSIWRTSYYGFIQGEIKTFYPIVLKNCGEIANKSIQPVFMTFETAQYLVSKAIEPRRDAKGIFAGLTSFTDRIAIDLTSNLVKAATSDIPYYEIGSRLYNALEQKNDIKKQIFSEADEIISAYRKKCLELGILDFGMAVDLYNNCLLKDEEYKAHLFKRVEHIIVDNIEECVPTEVDFIEYLLPNLKTCLLGYNHECGYGEIFGGNHEYMKKKLLDKCSIIDLEGSYTCKEFMYEFSDMLYNNIEHSQGAKLKDDSVIIREAPVELRSEMLENIGQKICSLIKNEGYKPSDIAVISTYADPVTEFVIGRMLEKEGIQLKNLTRKNRVVDNPFSQALITLAHLCHPGYNIFPNRDDVKALIRMLLKIDPVRSSILAGEICSQRPFAELPDVEFPGLVERIGYYNLEKYEYIRNWIKEYKERENPLPINEFFQKVFLEILISREISDDDILQAKKLIDSAQTFVDTVSRFSNMNANKGFLDMIRGGIKAAESIFELEETLNGDSVILSTPIAYLSSTLKSRIIILSGISSENWTPRSIKELTNAHVLTKTWDTGKIYTEEMEESYQRHYLAIIMRALLRRCSDRLYTFESNLSANGYENNGMLPEYLDEMLQ
ncbi:UvrD-helicase domain-containing protein [Clostridium thermosuccinogenes]|uniref:UvrD-helicase domain-containing protein n=1 Tax=Clostridium thermosuccinogenes TaxID=84032 RepID=UPI001FA94143|nr:UvrD-helicase domain-containing protein [Pseudoclostridium thermosuccinogenes]